MDIIPQIIVNSIIAGSIYTLIAIGFNLIYSTTKFFNITHGVMMAIGAYTVFFLSKQLEVDIWLAILAGVLFAGTVGWLLDRFIYRPLREKKASQLVLLIASFGAFTVLQASIAILFSSRSQTLSKDGDISQVFTIVGASITETQILIILSAILVSCGLLILLRFTKFGTMVRAISDDEEVSKIIGINTNTIIGITFFIGSAISGLAGILIGFDTSLTPNMGLVPFLKGVIAAIVGGVGSVGGGVIGAFLLGFIENFGIIAINGAWKDAIAFSVLILFLLFRPRGIIKS